MNGKKITTIHEVVAPVLDITSIAVTCVLSRDMF